jgi:hypothetical protein
MRRTVKRMTKWVAALNALYLMYAEGAMGHWFISLIAAAILAWILAFWEIPEQLEEERNHESARKNYSR